MNNKKSLLKILLLFPMIIFSGIWATPLTGADLDLQEADLDLLEAAGKGDLPRVEMLLQQATCSVDLGSGRAGSFSDGVEDSALIKAACSGHIGVVERLLSREEVSRHGIGVALVLVAGGGYQDIFKLLLFDPRLLQTGSDSEDSRYPILFWPWRARILANLNRHAEIIDILSEWEELQKAASGRGKTHFSSFA